MLGLTSQSVQNSGKLEGGTFSCSHEHQRACHLLLHDDCIPPRERLLATARSYVCCGTLAVAMPVTRISIPFERLYCADVAALGHPARTRSTAWRCVATSCGHKSVLADRRRANARHSNWAKPIVNRMKCINV